MVAYVANVNNSWKLIVTLLTTAKQKIVLPLLNLQRPSTSQGAEGRTPVPSVPVTAEACAELTNVAPDGTTGRMSWELPEHQDKTT